jgi:predicted flavoprotein YhiN
MNTLDRYGCPYKFAIDFLIKNGIKLEERENGIKYEDSNIARQVVRIAIEALEKQMDINKNKEENQ